jgi:hypothetical protein
MATQRNRIGKLRALPAVTKAPARNFPVEQTIYKLERALDAFNERIAELEGEGHHGRAMEELKRNALHLARQIDELRSVLAQQAKKKA